jgi:hypothetical protein
MIQYAYYLLLIIYGLALCVAIYTYAFKPAPGGDASVDWAWGFFYSIGLLVIVIIAVLLRNFKLTGLLVLCVPLFVIALPRIKQRLTDFYAHAPTLTKIPNLTLHIQNTTRAKVHVKLDCWFSTSNKGTSSLYTTYNYMVGPLEHLSFSLNDDQTRILAQKSKFITVMMYEQIDAEHEGQQYVREIQPCMQHYDEQIDAFGAGEYTIVIDESKNSDTFRQEVTMLKESNYYDKGVF